MTLFLRINLDVFCVLILIVMLASQRRHSWREPLESRLFWAMVLYNMAILATDIANWCLDGHPGPIAAFALVTVNLLYFGVHVLPPYFWLHYTHLQLFQDESRTRRLFLQAAAPGIITVVLTFITPFTGALFTVDSAGVYHRGPWIPLFIVCNYFYLAAAIFLTLRHRNRVDRRTFWSLLIFPLPGIIGGLIQAFVYGVTLIAPGMTLSLLLVYVNIQQSTLKTDYLTGVFNRMQADNHLRQRIAASRVRGAFSGILIDVDNFKTINDSHGHAVGDQALEAVAGLLRRSLRRDDFVARFGGDEFLVILEIQARENLERSVARIEEAVREYNASHSDQDEIALSMGFDVYNPAQGMTDREFLKHIDTLLYLVKGSKRLIRA